MKEEEAKQKVCPFMSKGEIVLDFEEGNTTGSFYDINKINCLGSECMAWKFKYPKGKGYSDEGYCKRLENDTD